METAPLWIALVSAVIVDIFVGDPRWLPHPIRWMGQVIIFLELFLISHQIHLKLFLLHQSNEKQDCLSCYHILCMWDKQYILEENLSLKTYL